MSEITRTNESIKSLPYLEIDVEPGLKLRQLDFNDTDKIFDLIDHNREYLGEWLPWVQHTTSTKDSADFIHKMLDKRNSGEEYGYGIQVQDEIVGHMSLMNLKDDNKLPEIGYWVASTASGKGIVTKAAISLTQFGLHTVGVEKIVIRANPDNIGSNKVAEKAGYTFSHIQEYEDGPYNIWVIAQ